MSCLRSQLGLERGIAYELQAEEGQSQDALTVAAYVERCRNDAGAVPIYRWRSAKISQAPCTIATRDMVGRLEIDGQGCRNGSTSTRKHNVTR